MERSLTCTYVAAAGFLTAATDPGLDGETQPWMKEEINSRTDPRHLHGLRMQLLTAFMRKAAKEQNNKVSPTHKRHLQKF